MTVGVYVDNMIIAGKDERQVENFKLALAERFDVKYLGRLHFFLGMKTIALLEMCG